MKRNVRTYDERPELLQKREKNNSPLTPCLRGVRGLARHLRRLKGCGVVGEPRRLR